MPFLPVSGPGIEVPEIFLSVASMQPLPMIAQIRDYRRPPPVRRQAKLCLKTTNRFASRNNSSQRNQNVSAKRSRSYFSRRSGYGCRHAVTVQLDKAIVPLSDSHQCDLLQYLSRIFATLTTLLRSGAKAKLCLIFFDQTACFARG